jgi:hypothetical protein
MDRVLQIEDDTVGPVEPGVNGEFGIVPREV